MSTPQKPEENIPPQAGGELPDFSEQQSLFSKRSGIQDPLMRSSESRTDERADHASRAVAKEIPREAPVELPLTARQVQTEVQLVETENPPGPASPRRKRKVSRVTYPKRVKSRRHLNKARRRQKNYLHQRRQKKKLRVFYSRIRLIFKLCFAVLWIALLAQIIKSPLWQFSQPRFTLYNAHLIQPDQVAPWINDMVGKPIYAIDPQRLAQRIQSQLDIASLVVVRRQMFPTRLEVTVQEKQPWAEIYATNPAPARSGLFQIEQSEGLTETDKPDRPLPRFKSIPPPKPYGLIVPEGMIGLNHYRYRSGLWGATALQKIIMTPQSVFSTAYMHRLSDLAWQADHIQGLHLQSIDVRNPRRIMLNYEELPVVLGPMNATVSERLARLIALIPKINEYRDNMESVDLQWEEQVTFHQKPHVQLESNKPEQNGG
jgi:cell division septal protein FtsQ